MSFNCLDAQLPTRGNDLALVFESEAGHQRKLTYGELHAEVCRFANALRALGVGVGDRVVIYMPLVPEVIVAMQACARIGAMHSVVFGGFSALSLRDRIEDAGARFVITADGGWRGGKVVELKAATDKALEEGAKSIEKVIVLKHCGVAVHMDPDRDLWWSDAMKGQSTTCEPTWVDAEHPLFLLYTSGSTGKPKGIQHSSAGYLLGAKLTSRWVFDLQSSDVYWCTADVGWVTGHSYVAYGPLANGATVVLYEGGADLAGRGPLLEDRAGPQGQHLLYRAHCDPRADEARRSHSREVRPDLAAPAGQRRRADQSGSLDVVPPRDRRRSAARSWIPGGRPRPAPS